LKRALLSAGGVVIKGESHGAKLSQTRLPIIAATSTATDARIAGTRHRVRLLPLLAAGLNAPAPMLCSLRQDLELRHSPKLVIEGACLRNFPYNADVDGMLQ
jgi:hypothetical protein